MEATPTEQNSTRVPSDSPRQRPTIRMGRAVRSCSVGATSASSVRFRCRDYRQAALRFRRERALVLAAFRALWRTCAGRERVFGAGFALAFSSAAESALIVT